MSAAPSLTANLGRRRVNAAESSSTCGRSAPFAEEHRSTLAMIAFLCASSVDSCSAGLLLDAVQDQLGAAATTTTPEAASLTCYPEVRLLLSLHGVRSALRNLQNCPAHARCNFFLLLRQELSAAAHVVPDPLLLALAELAGELADSTETAAQEYTHALEVQILGVVESLQAEVLASSCQLTRRADSITLRYAYTMPFTRH